jgi:hypothetical protein
MIACWALRKPPRCCRFRRTGFTATLANYRLHGGSGGKRYAFPTEGSRRGFEGISESSFAKGWYLECVQLPQQQTACPLTPVQASCNNGFLVLFSEVDIDRRLSRNQTTTPGLTSGNAKDTEWSEDSRNCVREIDPSRSLLEKTPDPFPASLKREFAEVRGGPTPRRLSIARRVSRPVFAFQRTYPLEVGVRGY